VPGSLDKKEEKYSIYKFHLLLNKRWNPLPPLMFNETGTDQIQDFKDQDLPVCSTRIETKTDYFHFGKNKAIVSKFSRNFVRRTFSFQHYVLPVYRTSMPSVKNTYCISTQAWKDVKKTFYKN
jgi:hypothetical protein